MYLSAHKGSFVIAGSFLGYTESALITPRRSLVHSQNHCKSSLVPSQKVIQGEGQSQKFSVPEAKISSLHFSSLLVTKRAFSFQKKSDNAVKVDPKIFDKETVHYSGKLFGVEVDSIVFYAKVGGCILAIMFIFHLFMKGYYILTRFSLQTVARLGFMGGFLSCLLGYSAVITVVRRRAINVNAVYNQSIALVMHHDRVRNVLGSHPRTGEFKTYALTGGFKLPLLRRIRSGSYELSDLLGLKQRRLQMLFVLKNHSTGFEGLVACDVRKESSGVFSSSDVFKSLSVTLSDPKKEKTPEIIVLVGRPEDVIYYNMLH